MSAEAMNSHSICSQFDLLTICRVEVEVVGEGGLVVPVIPWWCVVTCCQRGVGVPGLEEG